MKGRGGENEGLCGGGAKDNKSSDSGAGEKFLIDGGFLVCMVVT